MHTNVSLTYMDVLYRNWNIAVAPYIIASYEAGGLMAFETILSSKDRR